jgi:cephalosporin-C deacetylase-like acetyl esterase
MESTYFITACFKSPTFALFNTATSEKQSKPKTSQNHEKYPAIESLSLKCFAANSDSDFFVAKKHSR